MKIETNISLSQYTSWLIGGPAEYFCTPTTEEELQEAWMFALDKGLPLHWLGGGTNVLISDQGLKGLTVCLRRFSKLDVKTDSDSLRIQCLSGTGKSDLLKIFLKYKLEPALFLAGLPGDVGGGIVMNAGVSESLDPREFYEIVEAFEVLKFVEGQFQSRLYTREEIQWSYRHSHGWQPGVITKVFLSWKMEPKDDILDRVKNANRVRLSKQPLDLPSCGSVFKNPADHKAAQLIESCGLKGLQFGGAQVSTKHSNFIVNLGGATAEDTWRLILHVQNHVFQKTGVQLKTEVVRFGEFES